MTYPKNLDGRRHAPRIAIRPSSVAKVDELIKLRGLKESRADVVEAAIEQLLQATENNQ